MRMYHFILVLLFALNQIRTNDDIKIKLDLSEINQLNSINFKSFLQNYLVSKSISYKTQGIIGISANLENITVADFENPKFSYSIKSNVDNGSTLNLIIEDVSIAVSLDYNIGTKFWFINLFDLSGANFEIEIELSSISLDIQFNNSNNPPLLTNFELSLKGIKTSNSFLNFIINTVINLGFLESEIQNLQTMILNQSASLINSALNKVYSINENLLNKQITADISIPTKPTLISENTDVNNLLTLGIDLNLYPTNQPFNYQFPPAAEMDFNPRYSDSNLSILISDFTINTIFYTVTQLNLSFTIDKNTVNPKSLPIQLTTTGLSQIFPQISIAYPNTYDVKIVASINPNQQQQPQIVTRQNFGSFLSLNIGLDFYVEIDGNSIQMFSLNVKLQTSINFAVVNSLITQIEIGSIVCNYASVISNIGEMPSSIVMDKVSSLFNIFLETLAPELNFDLVEMIENNLHIKVEKVIFSQKNGFTGIIIY